MNAKAGRRNSPLASANWKISRKKKRTLQSGRCIIHSMYREENLTRDVLHRLIERMDEDLIAPDEAEYTER